MKKYLVAVLLVLVSTATFAAAQMASAVTARVPFAFMVGSKSFPAGKYEFTATENLGEIMVANMNDKGEAIAPVITRLSPKSEDETAVVFDVAGANHYLSEIFMPGLDGFLVKGAPSQHTRVTVKGGK
jgi:hypothetical protein